MPKTATAPPVGHDENFDSYEGARWSGYVEQHGEWMDMEDDRIETLLGYGMDNDELYFNMLKVREHRREQHRNEAWGQWIQPIEFDPTDAFDQPAWENFETAYEQERDENEGLRRGIELLVEELNRKTDEIESLNAQRATMYDRLQRFEVLRALYPEPCRCGSFQRFCPKCGG